MTSSGNSTSVVPAIFTMGKGGSGKSTIAMLLASVAFWQEINLKLADGDPANPTLRRYFKPHFQEFPAALLADDDPRSVIHWLEEAVFDGDQRQPLLVDLGANLEGIIMRWLSGRGAIVADRVRAVVPVDCRDALSAASRIVSMIGPSQCLLVLNQYGGRNAAAAAQDALFRQLLDAGTPAITLPKFEQTLEDAHVRSQPPHEMLADMSPFNAHGALVTLREVEKLFSDYPEFAPWSGI